jgi:hypothetical protein
VLIGGDMRTATLIFDFTGGLLEESLREESFNTFEEITPKLLAECLSWWSGLKFDVTASFDDYGIIVDWAPSSSLFAGLDSAEQKEGFVFADNDAMRWFMLDSLWRTFSSEFGGEVFFTMNGGEPLVFEELYPVLAIPSDTGYQGSAACLQELTPQRHYLDASNLIGMYYPEDFTSKGSPSSDGSVKFEGISAMSSLYYWMEEDFEEHPENDHFVKEYKEKDDGSTVAWGQDEEYGIYLAYIWVVDPELYFGFESADWHAAVMIECPSEEYAKIWYENLDAEVVKFYTADGLDDSYFRTADEAMEILSKKMAESGIKLEGAALADYGEDELNGLKVYIFAYGKNDSDKFTAEEFFGVSVYGEVYRYDQISNEYSAFK